MRTKKGHAGSGCQVRSLDLAGAVAVSVHLCRNGLIVADRRRRIFVAAPRPYGARGEPAEHRAGSRF